MGSTRPWLLALVVASLVAMAAAACGDDDDAPAGNDDAASSPGEQTPATQLPSSTDAAAVSALTAAKAEFPADLADGYALGRADAPLALTVYEDFQCPFCLRYTATIEPALVEEYVAAGDLRIEFQNFPILGAESLKAALAGECAAQQNRFWDLHHELFLLQAEAGQLTDERMQVGRFSDEALRAIAEDLALDMGAYDACYSDPATLTTVEDMANSAREQGLTGTPGFVLNGVALPGAPANLEGWRLFMDTQLAGAE
jgi:protein-disulfide isomerase